METTIEACVARLSLKTRRVWRIIKSSLQSLKHKNIFILQQRRKTVAKIGKTVSVGYQNGFLVMANWGVV